MKKPRLYLVTITFALLTGGLLFGQGVYIYAKAQLAQVLLKSAWQESCTMSRTRWTQGL